MNNGQQPLNGTGESRSPSLLSSATSQESTTSSEDRSDDRDSTTGSERTEEFSIEVAIPSDSEDRSDDRDSTTGSERTEEFSIEVVIPSDSRQQEASVNVGASTSDPIHASRPTEEEEAAKIDISTSTSDLSRASRPIEEEKAATIDTGTSTSDLTNAPSSSIPVTSSATSVSTPTAARSTTCHPGLFSCLVGCKSGGKGKKSARGDTDEEEESDAYGEKGISSDPSDRDSDSGKSGRV